MTLHWPQAVVLILTALSSCVALTAEKLYTDQPPVTPELALSGSYDVGVTTTKINDPDRINTANFITTTDRPLLLEIWYPTNLLTQKPKPTKATYKNVTRLQKPFELQGEAYRDALIVNDGKFPVVVLSHGFTGYRTQMFYLGEHLASHGYIVIGIDHKDSTNSEVFDDATRASGFISTLYNRARDQQFVLNYFSASRPSNDLNNLVKRMDTNNAAIIGHSMGGFGAINTVGGCYDFKSEQLEKIGVPSVISSLLPLRLDSCFAGQDSFDLRWKAIQVYAPWGGEFNVHSADAMEKISTPMFYVAGDQDNTSGYKDGVKKLYQQTGSQHKYLMVYENARHNIAGHPAPSASFNTDFELGHYVEPSWNIETINRINKHMTLAFLDCHVKTNIDRCGYLPSREDIEQYEGSNGQYTEPWTGFKHLWGSGIRFYRQ